MIYVIHSDGGHVSQGVKKVLVVLGVVVVFITLTAIDNFTYPFKAESPNFSDVERAFSRLQFPSGWVEISTSENRGLHGRGCDPFNDSGCFHKSKTFKVPETESAKTAIRESFLSNGCPGILEESTFEGNSSESPKTLTSLSCQVEGGVIYYASISLKRSEVNVGAKTN